MRGLMMKDFRLMLQQKRFLLILVFLAFIFTFGQSGMFAVFYLSMLAMVFSVSTGSYDEYDNGYPFLMTLPFERKTYVREKYLLCIIMSAAGCLVGSILNLVKQEEGMGLEDRLVQTAIYLLVTVLAAAAILPLQMKFGAEQGRIYLFLVIGGLALAAGAVMEMIPKDTFLGEIQNMASGLGVWGIMGCFAGVVILLTLLSYCISVRVMEKKEF